MEKSFGPPPLGPFPKRNRRRAHLAACSLLVPLALVVYICAPYLSVLPSPFGHAFTDGEGLESLGLQCSQPEPLVPADSSRDNALGRSYEFLSSEEFRNASIQRLSGAVQIKTESFDDSGEVGEDTRWDVLFNFSRYLQSTFPLAHQKLQVDKVNTHGLMYTWKGSNENLKPTLLMAHQDTVPVPHETVPTWTHPPWSGHYDGKYIWGRGASDCKNQLIAILETVEELLGAGFEPQRTILVSFGFDEEISGHRGAGHLAPFIRERYGDDSVAVIVDEGATFEEAWGVLFAKPGTAEKGYTDVDITVRLSGGHSSVPTDHTSIGLLSEIVTRIEDDRYRPRLTDDNPYYAQLQCGARYSIQFPPKLKKLLAKRLSGDAGVCPRSNKDKLANEAAKQGPLVRYLMQTSQAVDIISGGAKVNALPETATATVNHRINVGETPAVVWDRLTAIAADVAYKYGLDLHAFDGQDPSPGSIHLVASNTTLAVAPVTPTGLDLPFGVLAGTTRALYGKDVIVSPGIMTGNTDTRYYWDLTRHIFRFGPGFDPDADGEMDGIHTVDERVSVLSHINAVKWFTLFVRNMDKADV